MYKTLLASCCKCRLVLEFLQVSTSRPIRIPQRPLCSALRVPGTQRDYPTQRKNFHIKPYEQTFIISNKYTHLTSIGFWATRSRTFRVYWKKKNQRKKNIIKVIYVMQIIKETKSYKSIGIHCILNLSDVTCV